MNIKCITYEEDYRTHYRILIDGEERLNVSDGEPEDNNLARNFRDVLGLAAILDDVFEAGAKPGSDLNLEIIKATSWEEMYPEDD